MSKHHRVLIVHGAENSVPARARTRASAGILLEGALPQVIVANLKLDSQGCHDFSLFDLCIGYSLATDSNHYTGNV